MKQLVKDILKLKKSDIRKVIDKKISDFEKFKNKSTKEWFSELCFCILTANSKAKTAIAIQKRLGAKGFCTSCAKDVKQCIIDNKHRFHNNKTKYIVEARKHIDIKKKIQLFDNDFKAREWLVDNVKGIGLKESSHFLRNVGYKNVAILDRHIQNLMVDRGLLTEKPQSLNKKTYLDIENKLSLLCKKVNLNQAELDFYLWYMKTGEVLK